MKDCKNCEHMAKDLAETKKELREVKTERSFLQERHNKLLDIIDMAKIAAAEKQ